ncbi:MAG: GH92 family glycosyl hydrolase [Verrucomicrobiota bacterium]|nr:GH92 family glycosyl hydrolase [Verrucomicrobiota bacterium]
MKTKLTFKQITPPLAGLMLLGTTSCGVPQKSSDTVRSGERDAALEDLVQYAEPMCGTAADNNTFPGAVAPFGMIQWSPDTEAGMRKGGYSDADNRISGFSLDHISGAGCSYGEDFQFMPLLGGKEAPPDGDRTAFAQPFSHSHETAKPGYYAVTFDDGVKVELTTTVRSGFGRFTYPGTEPATMAINAASDVNGSDASGISINPATREISGWSIGGYFCHTRARTIDKRKIYFYAVFDRPFAAYSTWSDDALAKGATNGTGTASGAFVTFDTSQGRTVLAKVGISYVSVADAKANVEAESPLSEFSPTDFDRAVASAGDTWNALLNRIRVSGGTTDEKQTFYSMLYHALLGPCVVSDANGRYLGYDGEVHTTESGRVQYGVFSGWDIYRSECQLLAMIAPKEASDMAQSLLVDYQQGGAFPRWGVMTEDSGVMMGDPAAPMIADFYAYGATNFDAQAALKGLIRAATDPSVRAPRTKTNERDALADYLKLGYVPEHQNGGYGNVSMTLEYASADFALSQFAKALGDETDSAPLLAHAQNWSNLYNPETGYLQMRRRDGSWAPGFTNNINRYDRDTAYVEGTAGQYLWMAPFNYKGLAAVMGGRDIAAKRLDTFFTQINARTRSEYCYLGNEPCLETPWIYDFLGQPCKTQGIVRRAMTELFSSGDRAYPGNDDVGEMSSWYVFAALGTYPELPGSDVLVLGSPLFPKAVLRLPDGDVTITGNGAGKEAPYVQSLTVNGRPWTKPWIRFADVSRGGTLVFDLGPAPNTGWGSDPADAPPSYPQ